MKALKHLFNISALAIGGTGLTIGTLGLLSGSMQTETMDMSFIAAAFAAAGAGLFYIGYRGLRKDAEQQALQDNKDKDGPDLEP